MGWFDTLNALKSTAQRLFEEEAAPGGSIYSRKLTPDELFRKRYKLPQPEALMAKATAQVACSPDDMESGHVNPEDVFDGKLFLSESFIVFESYDDPRALQFSLPLVTIRRVDRLPSRSNVFALRVQLYQDLTMIIQFEGMFSTCEYFCRVLKENLKTNAPLAKQLRKISQTFYSEYLVQAYKQKHAKSKVDQVAISSPPGGLGRQFGYPGDPRKLHDKSKIRLWLEYFGKHGRNIGMVRQQGFYKLIRVGLPNQLRGEIWELCSGSVEMRMKSAQLYSSLLDEAEGKRTLAIEEIEKDLNRSLPEYRAYQTPEGISRLRRVLTAYSIMVPEVGYCQAMNIVAAALLIYQTEDQAFWSLHTLTEEILPGYYSRTMYGTLLDQKVLEYLVDRTMPMLWAHFSRTDVPLSVVSLPWFLSLFVNSMPMVYAFRIIDIIFLEGSRTLFQVALAILRVNGERLLEAQDNTSVIGILKEYFETLDLPAHPQASSQRARQVTKFQELMVVAFKEFSIVTDDMILEHRRKYEGSVLSDIEQFSKRTQLRNIDKPRHMNREEMEVVYDKFYAAIQASRPGLGGQQSELSMHQFVTFLSGLCDWMQPKYVTREEVEYHPFVRRLFRKWDSSEQGALGLGDVISGLDELVNPDMMEMLNWFFNLFDDEGTGKLGHGAILEMADAFLLIVRPYSHRGTAGNNAKLDPVSLVALGQVPEEEQDGELIDRIEQQQSVRYLGAVSSFIQRVFEVTSLKPVAMNISDDGEVAVSTAQDLIEIPETVEESSKEGLGLPHFRMVVLADETLELLFTETLRASIHLTEHGTGYLTQGDITSFRSMMDSIVRDGVKLAAGLRRRVDEEVTDSRPEDLDADSMDATADDHALLDI